MKERVIFKEFTVPSFCQNLLRDKTLYSTISALLFLPSCSNPFFPQNGHHLSQGSTEENCTFIFLNDFLIKNI